MIIVQSPLTKKTDKSDNYFRVVQRSSRENFVFTFASANSDEAHWAFEEAHRMYDELGGASKGMSVTLWKKHPAFPRVELIGHGDLDGDCEPGVREIRKSFNVNEN